MTSVEPNLPPWEECVRSHRLLILKSVQKVAVDYYCLPTEG